MKKRVLTLVNSSSNSYISNGNEKARKKGGKMQNAEILKKYINKKPLCLLSFTVIKRSLQVRVLTGSMPKYTAI